MVLSQLTDGEPFDIVQNCVGDATAGAEAWRRLHKRYDPATGSRKRVLLRSTIAPPRVHMSELGQALEKWEELVSRYESRKDACGVREKIPEDVKMAAIEAMVPQDLEKHLLYSQPRMTDYETMRAEITLLLEARTGVRMKYHTLNIKPERIPMDVDSFVRAGKGTGKGNCFNC